MGLDQGRLIEYGSPWMLLSLGGLPDAASVSTPTGLFASLVRQTGSASAGQLIAQARAAHESTYGEDDGKRPYHDADGGTFFA
jgi:hypothetical protein